MAQKTVIELTDDADPHPPGRRRLRSAVRAAGYETWTIDAENYRILRELILRSVEDLDDGAGVQLKGLIAVAEAELTDHPRFPSGRFTNWVRFVKVALTHFATRPIQMAAVVTPPSRLMAARYARFSIQSNRPTPSGIRTALVPGSRRGNRPGRPCRRLTQSSAREPNTSGGTTPSRMKNDQYKVLAASG